MSSGASEARSSPAGSSEAGSSTPSVVLPAQQPSDDDLFYLCRPHAHHLRCAPPTEAGFAEALAAATDAQVKYVDEYGHTVVIWMLASYDWPDQVAALLARGVAVNATTNVGFTALHYAGRDDRRASARVLLAHGADRTIENVGGDTAAASARRCGNAEIAAYIDGYPETEKKLVVAEAKAKRDAETRAKRAEKKAEAARAAAAAASAPKVEQQPSATPTEVGQADPDARTAEDAVRQMLEQARRDASESAAQAPMEAEAPVDASAGEKRGRHDE